MRNRSYPAACLALFALAALEGCGNSQQQLRDVNSQISSQNQARLDYAAAQQAARQKAFKERRKTFESMASKCPDANQTDTADDRKGAAWAQAMASVTAAFCVQGVAQQAAVGEMAANVGRGGQQGDQMQLQAPYKPEPKPDAWRVVLGGLLDFGKTVAPYAASAFQAHTNKEIAISDDRREIASDRAWRQALGVSTDAAASVGEAAVGQASEIVGQLPPSVGGDQYVVGRDFVGRDNAEAGRDNVGGDRGAEIGRDGVVNSGRIRNASPGPFVDSNNTEDSNNTDSGDEAPPEPGPASTGFFLPGRIDG